MFLLAASRRQKQRDTSNRSGWPLCFRESSKTTKSHSNLCCPFASALGFPFSQFLARSFFLFFFILLLLSVLSIVSTFSSFTFYVTNTTIFSFLLVIYLSCSLSFSLSSFICHFTRPFVPLFRAISVQWRQANEDLSDCRAVLPLFLLFLFALTSAN